MGRFGRTALQHATDADWRLWAESDHFDAKGGTPSLEECRSSSTHGDQSRCSTDFSWGGTDAKTEAILLGWLFLDMCAPKLCQRKRRSGAREGLTGEIVGLARASESA